MQPCPHVCLRLAGECSAAGIPLPVPRHGDTRVGRGCPAAGLCCRGHFAAHSACASMEVLGVSEGARQRCRDLGCAGAWLRGEEPGFLVLPPGRFPALGAASSWPWPWPWPWPRRPSPVLALPAPVLGCLLPASLLPVPAAEQAERALPVQLPCFSESLS